MYLLFVIICLIHERVIAFEFTYFDFDPRIIIQRLKYFFSSTVSNRGKEIGNFCVTLLNWEEFWIKRVFNPFRTMISHVVFNVFYLDKNNIKLAFFYVWSEIKRNNFSFSIGLSTVLIAVFVSSLLQAINDKSGIVFLKLAENDVGESDMVCNAIQLTILFFLFVSLCLCLCVS